MRAMGLDFLPSARPAIGAGHPRRGLALGVVAVGGQRHFLERDSTEDDQPSIPGGPEGAIPVAHDGTP